MDIDFIYNKIIEVLKGSNHENIAKELENSIARGSTGSESLMLSTSYLLYLKHSNPKVYDLIKMQVQDYLNYCNQNGLSIK